MERLRDQNHQNTVLSPIYWWSPRRTWSTGGVHVQPRWALTKQKLNLLRLMFPCCKQQKATIKVQGLMFWLRAPPPDLKRPWNKASGLARNIRMLKAVLCNISNVLTQMPKDIHILNATQSLQITEHSGKSFQIVLKCHSLSVSMLIPEMFSHTVSLKDLFQGDKHC